MEFIFCCLTEKFLEGAEDEIKYDRDCIVVLSGEVCIVHNTGL